MFYSHEVLTSREHGVATVWLVATLGAKSTTRKVNRKAILEVDVPKACDMIIRPDAPMALRLQGNLLYGVSKVYHQQCGYALVDAEATRDRMKTMLKVIHDAALDPDAGKARRDQIVIPNDPNFIPGLMLPGLNIDFSVLEIDQEWDSPFKSSLVSSYLPRSMSSKKPAAKQLHLDLSSSEIGGIPMGDGLGYISEMNSVRKDNQIELPSYLGEEVGVLLQPDFEFDGDGNIVELSPQKNTETKDLAADIQLRDDLLSTVRNTALDFLNADNQPGEDMAMPDIDVVQDEGAGSLLASDCPQAPRGQLTDPDYSHVHEISSEVGEAKARFRRRHPKMFGVDEPAELRNSDLAQWNSEYARNMAVAAKAKIHNKLITIARKNAAFWVLGSGIGEVGSGLGARGMLHPLAAFAGDQLLAALTGVSRKQGRRKRSHDETEKVYNSEGSAGKRSRTRDGELEDGLAGTFDLDDGNAGMTHEDIEIGRQAPASLRDDDLSHMPWNITASVKSSAKGSSVYSRQAFASGGFLSSIGMSPGPDGLPSISNASFRRGRLRSASPLAGRGSILTNFQLPSEHDMDVDMDTFSGIEAAQFVDDPQAIQKPGWLLGSSVLDQETVNFYEYLKSRVEQVELDAQAGNKTPGVTFTTLLPPESSSHVTATQALLHVLTLATNGALRVQQDIDSSPRSVQDTGEIWMMLSSPTRGSPA